MSESDHSAPQGEVAGDRSEDSVTLEEAVHEVNHEESLEELDRRASESQARLLDLVPSERRAEIIARQQAEEAKRQAQSGEDTNLREAA